MNRTSPIQVLSILRGAMLQRGSMFGALLIVALLAFEVFNFSSTNFALADLLGNDLKFLGVRWATILAIAFCSIDFAGIARLFTPEQGQNEPAEVWYLFGAWVLAAAMNATLTWWGVSVAVHGHTALGSAIIGREVLLKIVPVFVAIMVWIIRILLIGTFAMAGERIFSMADDRSTRAPISRFTNPGARPVNPTVNTATPAFRPAPKPQAPNGRVEPSYHPVGMAAKSKEDDQAPWR